MNLHHLSHESKDLPLSLLDAPGLDLRDGRDEHKLVDIIASIQRHGVLQPLLVVRAGERFEIVDGFTRFLCAGRAGLVVVPCWIFSTRDAALEGVKYDTAVMRLELTPAEEATYFHALFLGECGEDIDAVAARVGRTRAYVDSRLQLLLGDAEILQAVRDEQISLGVAQWLNRIDEQDYRRYYLGFAIRGGATVSVVMGWVTEYKNMRAARVDAPAPPPQETAPVVGVAYDPHRCYVCRESDPRHLPQMVPIHSHCQLAILDKLLAAYHGDSSSS